MKKLMIPLLTGVLIAIFTFYLNNNKPEIVYTTSENIAPFNESKLNTKSNIQQITIKNIGKAPAKNIQVKINGAILDSVVIKDSVSDKVELHDEGFELIYAELPPDGSFKLVVKSTLNKLDDNVLTVKSSSGLAKNGLENTKKKLPLLSLLVILIYLFYILYLYKETFVSKKILRYMRPNNEPISLLNNKKPFYFTENDWKELLEKFIDEKIRKDLGFIPKKLNELNSYFILLNEKPLCFSDQEWGGITEKTKEAITRNIENALIKITYDENELNKILTSYCDSTNQLPGAFRNELSISVSKFYILHKKNKYHITTEGINEALLEEKPSFVKTEEWKEYIKYLVNLQFIFILSDMSKSYNNPFEILEKYKSSLNRNKSKLEEIAYNIKLNKFLHEAFEGIGFYRQIKMPIKPNWIQDSDYVKLERIVETIKSTMQEKEEVIKQSEVISDVISGLKLPESKPDFISDYYWNSLKKYVKNTESNESLQKELIDKEMQLNKGELSLINQNKETDKLKTKIENQLKIINDLIKEPSSIYRVEEYSDSFAIGNLENLKTLADFLIEKKSS